MTVRLIIDWICCITASSLFFIIEEVIEPNITFDGTINVLLWLFALPLFIMNFLLTILPTFTNYRKTSKNKSFKSCSSGRHNRRGRHSNRHHVWWHESPYRKSTKNKEPSSRKRLSCSIRHKERDIHWQIDQVQYDKILEALGAGSAGKDANTTKRAPLLASTLKTTAPYGSCNQASHTTSQRIHPVRKIA
jgi:hypothetical protein